jgi:hypothetical protein
VSVNENYLRQLKEEKTLINIISAKLAKILAHNHPQQVFFNPHYKLLQRRKQKAKYQIIRVEKQMNEGIDEH